MLARPRHALESSPQEVYSAAYLTAGSCHYGLPDCALDPKPRWAMRTGATCWSSC